MDELNDIFKQAAAGYTLQPAPAVWAAVAQDLDRQRRRKRRLWWWLLGLLALGLAGYYLYAGNRPGPIPEEKAMPPAPEHQATYAPRTSAVKASAPVQVLPARKVVKDRLRVPDVPEAVAPEAMHPSTASLSAPEPAPFEYQHKDAGHRLLQRRASLPALPEDMPRTLLPQTQLKPVTIPVPHSVLLPGPVVIRPVLEAPQGLLPGRSKQLPVARAVPAGRAALLPLPIEPKALPQSPSGHRKADTLRLALQARAISGLPVPALRMQVADPDGISLRAAAVIHSLTAILAAPVSTRSNELPAPAALQLPAERRSEPEPPPPAGPPVVRARAISEAQQPLVQAVELPQRAAMPETQLSQEASRPDTAIPQPVAASVKPRRWSLSGGFALTRSDARTRITAPQLSYLLDSPQARTGNLHALAWNLRLSYNITPWLEAGTGLGVYHLGERINAVQQVRYFGAVVNVQSRTSNYLIGTDSAARISNKLSYLEIPLQVKLQLFRYRALSLLVDAGISANVAIGGSGYAYDSVQNAYAPYGRERLRSLLASYQGGLTARYRLNKVWSAEVNGWYRQVPQAAFDNPQGGIRRQYRQTGAGLMLRYMLPAPKQR